MALCLIPIAIVIYLLYKFIKADTDLTLLLATKFGKPLSVLSGQVVWITGSSSGIGEHLAYELCQHGVKLILSGTNVENLNKVRQNCLEKSKKLLGEEDILVLPFDITDFDKQPEYVQKVIDHFGRIDILVNNAGRTQRAGFEDIDLKVDQAMFNTNVFGSIVLTRLVIPHFIKQGKGHVVVTSSVAGKFGAPGSATYSGTKFALHGYFECMRAELNCKNISVTFLCPGPVFSNILAKAYTSDPNVLLGGSQQPGEKRMATSKCSYLSAVAIANKLDEAWICIQPVLTLMYISQYMPSFYRNFILKKFFTAEVASKLREGKF